MGVQPNFVAIGPGRCGTTWLYEMLSAHPKVGMAQVKETEFFNTNYEKGSGWYEAHFPDERRPAIGEISNNYYLDPEVARRLQTYRPGMKLIVGVRNPYGLLESFHAFGLRRGLELPPLGQALDYPIGPIMGSGYDERLRSGALTTSDSVTLLESVMLGARLEPFFRTFPQSQIYVFVYERLALDPQALLSEVYDFLGVDPGFVPDRVRDVVNPTVAPRAKVVAQVASRAAFALRSIGAYRMLNALRDSPLVRGLLYRAPSRKASKSVSDVRDTLPRAAIRRIDEDTLELLPSLHPALRFVSQRYAPE
jgi:hypothetical protein